MSTNANRLLPYVPAILISQIADRPNFPEQPTSKNFTGVALFADISGFTSLTEKLVARGPQGVETLSRILNEYFGKLTEQIKKYNGDVVNFAGDSLLAIWEIKHQEEKDKFAQVAVQCAQHLQNELNHYVSKVGEKLSMRIGIGIGEARAYYLGGYQGKWEFILTGDAVEQAYSAEKIAVPGDVILSENIWDVLNKISGIQGNQVDKYVRLINIPFTDIPNPINLPILSEDSSKSLQSFISPAITTRLTAEQIEWLAELRRVTVLFVNLKNFNSETLIEHAAQVIHAIQEAVFRFEGSIHEIGMDEKGASPLVVFGLSSFVHEDDPFRSVMAAQEISKRLNELNQPHSIGITTGRVFCGVIGGSSRADYAILGDVVNTAARFMQTAGTGQYTIPILCDLATQQSASRKMKFKALGQIQLKGKSEAVLIFHPMGDLIAMPQIHPDTPVVGRNYEKQVLHDTLLRTSKENSAHVIVLEGEAGIGKSRLIEYVEEQAKESGAVYFACVGDAVEKNTSYFSWRNMLRQLLGIETISEPSKQKELILARLSEKWSERASLLNSILGTDFEEPYFVEEMSGEVRAENVRAMFIDLLQEVSKEKTVVITLEDAHWQDSASWALTLEMSRINRPFYLVIATRLLDEPLPAHYQSLFAQKTTQRLILNPLALDDALQLVKQRLQVTTLPEDMETLIRTKAEGNPFFSEELAYSLRDLGLIEIKDNMAHIVKGVDLKSFSFPDTVQGIVTSRIDRLKPQEQLCIKVASVIGRIFTYRVLNDIHPIASDKAHLQYYLDELQKFDLTPLETVTPELTYIFKHAITQDVAYNLMLFGQRQELHKIIANWYEENFKEDLTPFYVVLAHHWRFSGNHEKALVYLEASAGQALDNFANREVVDFINLIFQIDAQSPITDNFRRAIWSRKLGQAYKGLGNMETSRAHLQDALRLMGYHIPKNQVGWVFDLIGQLLRRMLLPLRKVSDDSKQKVELQEAALAYQSLSEIYYYAIDLPPFLSCLLHLINTVEQVGDSAEMARSYSVTALVAGLIPLHGIAKRYEKRSLAIIDSIGQFEDLAFAMSALSLYNMGIGDFEQALRNMTRAVESVTFLNNRPRMAEVFTTTAQVYLRLGQYKESYNYFEKAYQTGLHAENPQHQVWGLNGMAGVLLYQGGETHAERALELIQGAIPLLAGSTDHTEDIRAYGMMGIANIRLNQFDQARLNADKGLHFIATTSPAAHDAMEGYAGVAETYLHLLESTPSDKDLNKQTLKALKGLLNCGKLFPIVMPRYWCYQGWYAWIRGNQNQAISSWEKGLGLANQLQMKYEAARLYFEIGRHHSASEELQKALERFEALNANYDLKQTFNLINKT